MIDILLAWLTWVANAFDRHREKVVALGHWGFAWSCGASMLEESLPPIERAALVAGLMLEMHFLRLMASAWDARCFECALHIERQDLADRIRVSGMGMMGGIAWHSLWFNTLHAAAAWDPPVP